MEERVGFEPTIPITRNNGFQDRRFRPLSHLSTSAVTRLLTHPYSITRTWYCRSKGRRITENTCYCYSRRFGYAMNFAVFPGSYTSSNNSGAWHEHSPTDDRPQRRRITCR